MNMTTTLNSKKIFASCFVLSSTLMIVSCGGGDDKKEQASSNPIPEPTALTVSHKVELGLISRATVSIYAIDQVTLLFEVQTDQAGIFKINKEELQKKIAGLKNPSPYIWIKAKGGYDLDPNDDGVLEQNEAVPLKGAIFSIVKADSFLNESGFKFNLITSAIAELLINSDDLNDERILQLASQLRMPDLNKNTQQDMYDVLHYQMGSFVTAETNLREYYLTQIHENNTDGRKLSTELLKGNIETIRVAKTITNDKAEIELFPLDKTNTIYYGDGNKAGIDKMLPSVYKRGQKIPLLKNQGISFQECSEKDIATCRQRQSFDFFGSTPTYAEPLKITNNPYTDPIKIKAIADQVYKSGQDFIQAQNTYEASLRAVSELEKDINEKQAQINAIDEQIRQLQSTNTGGSSNNGGSNTGGGTTIVAPTGLTATPKIIGGTKGIQLSWNAVSNADDYYVFRDGSFLLAQNASSGASFFENITVSGKNYCYTVQAVKGGSSPNSNQACATAP